MMNFSFEDRITDGTHATIPATPLKKGCSFNVWNQNKPTLRIINPGSNFCDPCSTLKSIAEIDKNTKNKATMIAAREKNRKTDTEGFSHYTNLQNSARLHPHFSVLHFLFHFAEKLLLPVLLRQPGQLNFIKGLKIDSFRVSFINFNTTYIHFLPEIHFRGRITANEVTSMLHHSINIPKDYNDSLASLRVIQFHVENFGGQNKNRLILSSFLQCLTMRLEDGRKLKRSNVFTPLDRRPVVDSSSPSNKVFCSVDIRSVNWKWFFEPFFCVPSAFRISQYHIFKFSNYRPRLVDV